MGGIGSGNRWRLGVNDKTDDYRAIDVRRWQRDGLLVAGRAFGWQWSRDGNVVASIRVRVEMGRVFLTYRHRSGGGEWKDENYPVRLDWTSCNLGGHRPWFRCPALGCGRRVAILYGGAIFACRHCYRLAYPSQCETYDDRALRKADRIRDRLGWFPGVMHGHGLKPKGMHWATYRRLVEEHDLLVDIAFAGMEQRMGVIQSMLDDLGMRG